jgi:hypothetical protein
MSLKLVDPNEQTPSDLHPEPLVVLVLEEALARARAGKVRGVMLVINDGTGHEMQRAGGLNAAITLHLFKRFEFSVLFDQMVEQKSGGQ